MRDWGVSILTPGFGASRIDLQQYWQPVQRADRFVALWRNQRVTRCILILGYS